MTVPFATAAALAGTRHGFCGRAGGVSGGIFASLNTGLGSSDDTRAVAENRRRAAMSVAPGAALVTVHQVHSATVVVADPAMADGASITPARVQADGVVTDRPGLVLGVLAADCAPVLFADVRAGVVGAAHAGWKGALYGVLPAAVAAMAALGARHENITAVVGPCIAQGSYEVQDAYADPFLAADPGFARFFRAGRAGHLHFDLEGFVAARLAAAGVTRVECLGRDTYTGDYFSYRRSVHAGEPDYGRNLSLISLAR
jgi:YfiH family protein